MKAGSVGWWFPVSGDPARVIVVSACVLTLLSASSAIEGQATQAGKMIPLGNQYEDGSVFEPPPRDDWSDQGVVSDSQPRLLEIEPRLLDIEPRLLDIEPRLLDIGPRLLDIGLDPQTGTLRRHGAPGSTNSPVAWGYQKIPPYPYAPPSNEAQDAAAHQRMPSQQYALPPRDSQKDFESSDTGLGAESAQFFPLSLRDPPTSRPQQRLLTETNIAAGGGRPSRKAVAPSATDFRNWKGTSSETVGQCGLHKVDARDITPYLRAPNWYYVMGNIAVGLDKGGGTHRRFLGRIRRFLQPARCEPEQLIKGLKDAAEGALGLKLPPIREGFERLITAVVRYRSTNVFKRHWRCRRQRVEHKEADCNKSNIFYQELLFPLKAFMCSRDLWNTCGAWGLEEGTTFRA